MANRSQTIVSEFSREWAKLHPDRQPMGWMLRTDDSLPWLRLHALPDSKRYAENGSERSEILSRANEVGNQLLGAGEPCWMIEARTDDCTSAGELAGQFDDSDEYDTMIWRYFVQSVNWRAGAFDKVLMDLADDAPYSVVWMARESGAIFAPYDGGFDLFPSEYLQVDTLKAQWSDWLSSHPEGL